jgi:hypothetical protein
MDNVVLSWLFGTITIDRKAAEAVVPVVVAVGEAAATMI